MYDVIVCLNASLSQKNGFPIFETYETRIKLNKYGRHIGGSISPIDIMSFSSVSLKHIAEAFHNYGYRLSKNAYFVPVRNFSKLYDAISNGENVYLDGKDGSLYVIANLLHGGANVSIKEKINVGGTIISYQKDNTLRLQQSTTDFEPLVVIPVPIMDYSPSENIFELAFDYYGDKTFLGSRDVVFNNGDAIVLRNFEYESLITTELLNNNFTKLARSRFVYSGSLDHNSIATVLKNIGIVYKPDSHRVPDLSVKRVDSDWFQIDVSILDQGTVVDLASRIDLSSSSVTHAGKKLLLPNALIDSYGDIVSENGTLRIHRKHILSLLRIINISKNSIDDLFDPKNVTISIPDGVCQQAFPYQLEGIRWLKFLYKNGLGGCLADDMGLGKTFQTIAFLQDNEVRSHIKKVLFVVPKSLIANWVREISAFSTGFKVGVFHGVVKDKLDLNAYDFIITTYATARLEIDALNKIKYDLVVFDEIQIIKNFKGETSIALKEMNSNFRLGLSGTPMENNLSEIWNVLDVLNPGAFGSRRSFLSRYDDRNLAELKNLLRPFILRRLKTDVLPQLPSKTENTIYCEMGAAQRHLYESIVYAVRKEIMELKAFSAPMVLRGLLLLRQCCCSPRLLNKKVNVDGIDESCKLEALNLLVDNAVESGHKILIFSQFTQMLQEIKDSLARYKERIFYLDGKSQNRDTIIKSFEESDEGIFLISIKAGGVGLNLTSAQDVVIYDPWWNPFLENQAIDRVYRIGQKNSVNIYKLVAANSIEEKILDMQANKTFVFDQVLNSLGNTDLIDLQTILQLLS